VRDLLGGDLLLAEVLRPDGSRQGVHGWNRLPGGREVDLTREQFAADELVQVPRVVERPPGPPRRGAEQYAAFRAAVEAALESAMSSAAPGSRSRDPDLEEHP
jgi:hypothetical protein